MNTTQNGCNFRSALDSQPTQFGSFQSAELPMVTLDRNGLIVSCNRAILEIYDCTLGALFGSHWSVLCAETDVDRVIETRSKPTENDYPSRLYIALRVVDPVRVAELTMVPLAGGGSLWIFNRVSTGTFPPLDSGDLVALIANYRHSLGGQIASASTAIQLLQATSVSDQDDAGNRRCEHALDLFSSLNELIDDGDLVLKIVLGMKFNKSENTDVLELVECLTQNNILAGVSVSLCETEATSVNVRSCLNIKTCRGLLHHLLVRILRLCARYVDVEATMRMQIGVDSQSLWIHFFGPGMVIPKAVAELLRNPLDLHRPEFTQTSLFFEVFVIGLFLRELSGCVVVADTAGSIPSGVRLYLPLN